LEQALWYLHLFLQLSVMNVIAIPVWILCNALVTLVGSSWWGFISSELLPRFCLLGIMNSKLFHNFSIILLLLYPESSNSFSAPMKTVALLMIPFFFFLGAICCIQCMWWAPQDFTVDRDLSFPWIDFSQQACVCVCGIGVLLMEAEMGFASPQWVGATLPSQGGSQISESHVDRMVGEFLRMSILVFKNLGTKLSFL
jgi:hypothetical protein